MKFLKLVQTTDLEVGRPENCNKEAECCANVLDDSTSGTLECPEYRRRRQVCGTTH